MKIKVQIDSAFQEETLQIQAPRRTPKIQQVVEFVESLDDNHRLKGKRMAKLISSSLMLFPEFTSKIVKFQLKLFKENATQAYVSIKFQKNCHLTLSKSHNQRLSILKKSNASTLPLTVSLKFTLKTRKPPTHHAVTSKQ